MHERPQYTSCFPCPLALALTKTLALVGGTIHEYLGGNYIAKGQEHLHQLIVSKLLREVVDEEIAAFRTCRHGGNGEGQNRAPKGKGKRNWLNSEHSMGGEPHANSSCLDLHLLISHWSTKGSEGSLKCSWEAVHQLQSWSFWRADSLSQLAVPMWGAGHNNSVST